MIELMLRTTTISEYDLRIRYMSYINSEAGFTMISRVLKAFPLSPFIIIMNIMSKSLGILKMIVENVRPSLAIILTARATLSLLGWNERSKIVDFVIQSQNLEFNMSNVWGILVLKKSIVPISEYLQLSTLVGVL